MEITKYENYPFWIIMVFNFVSTAIYVIGAYIMYRVGIIWLVIYLLYIIFLETRILSISCVRCYYYGKSCAFGRGKISCLFFKKGESQKFSQRQITWKAIIPDFLVSIIPAVIGIVLLIRDFNWLILLLIVILFLLSSAGNGFIRGSLACKHCKQQDLGCPAAQLFYKNRDNNKND